MRLIIGGYAQGKLDYVLRKYGLDRASVYEGAIPERAEKTTVIYHFQDWVYRKMKDGESPEEEIIQFVNQYPDCMIISDEVGNGIVPIEAAEREYRERLGRILVILAERAEEVERVICGIGQKLK